MRRTLTALTIGSALLSGCHFYVGPPVVVHREVVERERVYEDDVPPPARVEVVPVAPYFGAVWIPGYWARGYHHRWFWVRGHWN